MRDRDTTAQVRVPLADVPGLLAKLCGASPLCWADLKGMFPSPEEAAEGKTVGGADASAAGKDGVMAYLQQHGVAGKLNEAIREGAKSQPADPIAAICEFLKKA